MNCGSLNECDNTGCTGLISSQFTQKIILFRSTIKHKQDVRNRGCTSGRGGAPRSVPFFGISLCAPSQIISISASLPCIVPLTNLYSHPAQRFYRAVNREAVHLQAQVGDCAAQRPFYGISRSAPRKYHQYLRVLIPAFQGHERRRPPLQARVGDCVVACCAPRKFICAYNS